MTPRFRANRASKRAEEMLNSDWPATSARYSQINKPRPTSPHFCPTPIAFSSFPVTHQWPVQRFASLPPSIFLVFVVFSFLFYFLHVAAHAANRKEAENTRTAVRGERGRDWGSPWPQIAFTLASRFSLSLLSFCFPCWRRGVSL
jgi:hypothetical protein